MRLLSCLAVLILVAEPVYANIHEDILAKPYFEISFPGETISSANANALREATQTNVKYHVLHNGTAQFLCAVPNVTHTRDKTSAEERLKLASIAKEESLRASARGRELLSGIEGTCLYYIYGWWTYKFCYGGEIIQFHALPHTPGVPMWPPRQDVGAAAYSLGKWSPAPSTNSGDTPDVKVNGESKSLIMQYTKGTYCPLIGAERSTEVHFQCSPTTDDRILSAKEVTSCQYVLVIQTARLCNDVAFQETSKEKGHEVKCTRISDEKSPPTLDTGRPVVQESETASIEPEDPLRTSENPDEQSELLLDKKVEQELSHLSFETMPDDIAALADDHGDSGHTAAAKKPPTHRHGAAHKSDEDKAAVAKDMAMEIASQLEEGAMTMNGESIFDAKNENVEFDVELQDENGELLGSVVMKVVDGEIVVEMDEAGAGLNHADSAAAQENHRAQEKVPPQLQAVFDRFVGHVEL